MATREGSIRDFIKYSDATKDLFLLILENAKLSFPTARLASPRAVVHQSPSSSAYRAPGSVNRVSPLAGESSVFRVILTHHSESDYAPNESSSRRKVALAERVPSSR
ncbi:hypothetical protein CEXT_372611 [Caerostris extrusa]|uniref:Uncharacterized protein n=1 Tax=Caerostris extrusa TaxID=172846 RepID=A0AAV4TVW9_CAEEX|nr:hypothetical protein CEXT_372611 [Caerostris extrusa]